MLSSPYNSDGDLKHITGINTDIEATIESQQCVRSSIGAGRAVEDRKENAHFVLHKLQCAVSSGFCCVIVCSSASTPCTSYGDAACLAYSITHAYCFLGLVDPGCCMDDTFVLFTRTIHALARQQGLKRGVSEMIARSSGLSRTSGCCRSFFPGPGCDQGEIFS